MGGIDRNEESTNDNFDPNEQHGAGEEFTEDQDGVDEDSEADEASDDQEEAGEDSGNSDDEEEEANEEDSDDDESDESEAASTEASDDGSEFDYLFAEEKKEPEKVPPDLSASLNDDLPAEMPKYLVRGTKEYFSTVKDFALQKFETEFGGVEYESLDDDHRIAFDEYVSEAKQLIDNKAGEIKRTHVARSKRDQADAEIGKILPTPELQKSFGDACGNMKARQFKQLEEAAAQGDFRGFISLAKRLKQAKEKVARVNDPKKKQAVSGKKTGGGVRALLGL